MATITTNMAQATPAAAVARDIPRALIRMPIPRSARIAGTQRANRLSCRAAETRRSIGSKTSRKVGLKATSVREAVSEAKVIGRFITQLLIAVPITASGFRAASGPQPRS